MSLTQELADFQNRFRENQAPEILATMQAATDNLERSGITDRTLKIGDSVPDFELPDVNGESVELRSLLQRGSVVLSFYRGGWCPYCNLELRALQRIQPQIQAAGATLVAVSPETPDNSLTTTEKNELSYPVLSDVGNRVAREFGLVFTLPETLRPLYAEWGIDIPAHNGDDRFDLPVPATYVIAPSGNVVLAFANADYTQRLDTEAILAALKPLQIPA
ncbi:MAG: peroxiredoxin-like family protein [Cyanobacteria bacterium J06648_11]